MSSSLRTVTGRLVFRQAGPPRPLAHVPFEAIWHHPVRLDRSLGAGRTGADGTFSVQLDDTDACTLRLSLQRPRRTYDAAGTPEDHLDVERTVDIAVGDPPEGTSGASVATDLGDVAVPWWPYRTDFPTPRVAAVDGKLPQAYTHGYMSTLVAAGARGAPAVVLLKGLNAFGEDRPSMETIQSHMPKTLTLRVEAEEPGRTRSDTWLADQLFNGFAIALEVGRDATDPTRYRVRIPWGDMPATNAFDLTDIDVTMADRGAEIAATSITLRIRTPGTDGAWRSDTTRTFTPADGAEWGYAKRVVRSQYLLHGALDGHIIRAHLTTEEFTVAAMRTLQRNPVRFVLFPHMQEIVAQDHDGDSFAWGPHGILAKQSALTINAIQARMTQRHSSWDWTTFRPRSVAHPTHRYAQAAHLFWDVLTEYLTGFFDDHAEGIAEAWDEVRAFSDTFVAHSLAHVHAVADPLVVPFDTNEADDPKLPRATVGGVVRALRPVTTTDTPQPGELAALLQLCRYILYQATFNHSWTHDGQYDAGGELAYATFGLRNGSLGPEDDASVIPVPALNIDAISTNALGTRTNYGYLLANEEHDVPPALQAALRKRTAAFAALGVDVTKIRSRINI